MIWLVLPIGSMYAIYGNIYHQYTTNVSINLPLTYGSVMGYVWEIPIKFHNFHLYIYTYQYFHPKKSIDLSMGNISINISTHIYHQYSIFTIKNVHRFIYGKYFHGEIPTSSAARIPNSALQLRRPGRSPGRSAPPQTPPRAAGEGDAGFFSGFLRGTRVENGWNLGFKYIHIYIYIYIYICIYICIYIYVYIYIHIF